MPRYEVSDMTCGHCVSVVEKVVKGIDPKAGVPVAKSCKEIGEMKECVDACRACAESCRRMAA
jgi:copper chaperone CopZ